MIISKEEIVALISGQEERKKVLDAMLAMPEFENNRTFKREQKRISKKISILKEITELMTKANVDEVLFDKLYEEETLKQLQQKSAERQQAASSSTQPVEKNEVQSPESSNDEVDLSALNETAVTTIAEEDIKNALNDLEAAAVDNGPEEAVIEEEKVQEAASSDNEVNNEIERYEEVKNILDNLDNEYHERIDKGAGFTSSFTNMTQALGGAGAAASSKEIQEQVKETAEPEPEITETAEVEAVAPIEEIQEKVQETPKPEPEITETPKPEAAASSSESSLSSSHSAPIVEQSGKQKVTLSNTYQHGKENEDNRSHRYSVLYNKMVGDHAKAALVKEFKADLEEYINSNEGLTAEDIDVKANELKGQDKYQILKQSQDVTTKVLKFFSNNKFRTDSEEAIDNMITEAKQSVSRSGPGMG